MSVTESHGPSMAQQEIVDPGVLIADRQRLRPEGEPPVEPFVQQVGTVGHLSSYQDERSVITKIHV